MTNEEAMKMSKRIYNGLDMISEKAEQIGREKKDGWSLSELGMMADIEKDISKSFKSLVKAHQMLAEHSIEKY